MRLWFTYLLFLFVLHAHAQTVIKGKVLDKQNRKPLPLVNVIYGQGKVEITDEQGNFLIQTDAKHIEISYKFVGYKTLKEQYFLNGKDSLNLTVLLQAENEQLSEIVVSANRREQRIADLSVSMSLIKPEYITQNNLIDADALINQVPGVEIMDGQASIRGGSGYSYGAGSRVLALIDGIPVLSADAGNIKWQFLPMENIGSVEIIKGASSVLYGSSALNGIINFRTADAEKDAQNKFALQTGIYDRPQQTNWIWWNNPRTFHNFSLAHLKKYGNTDVALSGAFQLDNSYRRLNDEILLRLNARIKHFSKNNPAMNYGFAVNAGYTRKTDFILWEDADYGALKQNPETASEMNGSFFTFEPFWALHKEKFKHDVRFQFQYTNNDFLEKTQNNSKAFSNYLEYQFIWKILNNLDLISGFSTTWISINSQFYDNHTGINAAGFMQMEYKGFEKLKLNGGIRYEYNAYDNISDKLVPVFRAGANFEASPYTFLRASFGQGYRYPSIAEKFASTTLGSIKIFPNLEIKPETGWSSELGIKQMFRIKSLKGQADISFFYSENSDMIEYILGIFIDPETGQPDFGFQATNIEDSRVYGLEPQISLMQELNKSTLLINIGYTYIYPEELNGLSGNTYLKYRSKHSFKATASFTYGKLRLGLNAFYRSKLLRIDDVFLNPATREQILPGFYDYWQDNNTGYLIFDANFAFLFNQKYELSFSAKNFTNVEYMGRPGDIRPQRNFSLQFTGKF